MSLRQHSHTPNSNHSQKHRISLHIMYMHHPPIRHAPSPQTRAPPHKTDKVVDNWVWANEPQCINTVATTKNENDRQAYSPTAADIAGCTNVARYVQSELLSTMTCMHGPWSNQESSVHFLYDYGNASNATIRKQCMPVCWVRQKYVCVYSSRWGGYIRTYCFLLAFLIRSLERRPTTPEPIGTLHPQQPTS